MTFEARQASCVIAVEEVPSGQTMHYGIVKAEPGDGDFFPVVNVVEKPRLGQAPSRLAIAGRYVFSPLNFDMIRRVRPGHRGEIQLTGVIQQMCEEGRRVLAFKLPPNEERYDIGYFPSCFETFVEFAPAGPVYGAGFRARLERMLEKSPAAL